jgi:hypothetical protein
LKRHVRSTRGGWTHCQEVFGHRQALFSNFRVLQYPIQARLISPSGRFSHNAHAFTSSSVLDISQVSSTAIPLFDDLPGHWLRCALHVHDTQPTDGLPSAFGGNTLHSSQFTAGHHAITYRGARVFSHPVWID